MIFQKVHPQFKILRKTIDCVLGFTEETIKIDFLFVKHMTSVKSETVGWREIYLILPRNLYFTFYIFGLVDGLMKHRFLL